MQAYSFRCGCISQAICFHSFLCSMNIIQQALTYCFVINPLMDAWKFLKIHQHGSLYSKCLCYLFIFVEIPMAEQSGCQQQGTDDLQQQQHTALFITVSLS